MADISYYANIDFNGNQVRNAADATLPQDYVTLTQLEADSPAGFVMLIGNGIDVTFTLNHGFNAVSGGALVYSVMDTGTGDYVAPALSNGLDPDNLVLTFAVPPLFKQFRVSIYPVRH